MADVTISSLPLGTPSSSALLPYSQEGTTYTSNPSAVVAGGIITGTWAPTLYIDSRVTNTETFGYNNTVVSTQTNTYSKIGNTVFFNCSFDLTGTSEQILRFITGLPFAPKSTGPVLTVPPGADGSFYKSIKGYSCSLGHCRGVGGRYGSTTIDSSVPSIFSATVSDDLTQPQPIGKGYISLWASRTVGIPTTYFWRLMPTGVENGNRYIFISGTYLTDQ